MGKKIILGFVGERGAGKDAGTDHLKSAYDVRIHKFSAPMATCLGALGLPKTTENLILWSELSREGHKPGKRLQGLDGTPSVEQVDACLEILRLARTPALRDQMRQMILNVPDMRGFGDNLYCKVVAANCLDDPTPITVASGIRRWSDVEDLRRLPEFQLIYVTAPEKLRYERVRNRGEKIEEKDLTWEQFLASQKLSTEVDIPEIGKAADFKFNNVGSKEAYHAFIDVVVKTLQSV